VSCGQKQLIEQEALSYRRDAPKDHSVGSTLLVRTAETLRFGAVVYRLVGGDLEEMIFFQDGYHRWSINDLKTVLERLFNITLASWHKRNPSDQKITSLVSFYLKQEDLKESLEHLGSRKAETLELAYSSQILTLYLPDSSSIAYPNPLTFLLESAIPFEKLVRYGTVPGRRPTPFKKYSRRPAASYLAHSGFRSGLSTADHA
jgi:hypothetical protein